MGGVAGPAPGKEVDDVGAWLAAERDHERRHILGGNGIEPLVFTVCTYGIGDWAEVLAGIEQRPIALGVGPLDEVGPKPAKAVHAAGGRTPQSGVADQDITGENPTSGLQ